MQPAKPSWRKSSRSGTATDCVEIANTLNAMRDSKNPTGPTLTAAVRALITAIKHDRIG